MVSCRPKRCPSGVRGQPVCRSHGLEHLANRERILGAEPVRHPAHRRPHYAGVGNGIEASDADRAGVGSQKGGQHEQKSGLARAMGAYERCYLARRSQ